MMATRLFNPWMAPRHKKYATNTPDSVIKADGNYYCCKDAVWYQSPQPNGPWVICAAVPQPILSHSTKQPSVQRDIRPGL